MPNAEDALRLIIDQTGGGPMCREVPFAPTERRASPLMVAEAGKRLLAA